MFQVTYLNWFINIITYRLMTINIPEDKDLAYKPLLPLLCIMILLYHVSIYSLSFVSQHQLWGGRELIRKEHKDSLRCSQGHTTSVNERQKNIDFLPLNSLLRGKQGDIKKGASPRTEAVDGWKNMRRTDQPVTNWGPETFSISREWKVE